MAMGRNLRRWLGIAAAGLAIGGAGAAVAVASSTGGSTAPVVQEAPAISPVQDSAMPAAETQPSSEGPGASSTPQAAEPNEPNDPKDMDGPNDVQGPDDPEGPGEMEEHESEEAPSGPAAVSEEQARATAQKEVPGGVVSETEREIEYGVDAYEVTIEAPDGRVIEVSIDSQTGEVVHIGEED